MFIHCKLAILLLTLTLNGQVHSGEIVGGHEAKPHSRPYMVFIERHMRDGKTSHCGGFLLNEDFVMTAAHCQARFYTVLLGVHNVNKKDEIQTVSVTQEFPQKNYNAVDLRNDIMLLKLSSRVNFTQKVKPIALAGQSDGSLPKSCTFSGWGLTDMNSKYMSPVLMEVNLTLIEEDMCPKENSYCSKGDSGPGPGDSGGPLVCDDGKAFGVMSCCLISKSGDPQICAFSKIPDYRDWIDSKMKQLKDHNI